MDNSAKKQKMLARKLTRYGIVGPDANMWTGETKMHCDGVHIKGLGNGDNAEEISMCGVALENIVWHCSDSDARSTFALGCGVLFNLGADANTCALVQGNMSHGTPMLSPDGDANRGSPARRRRDLEQGHLQGEAQGDPRARGSERKAGASGDEPVHGRLRHFGGVTPKPPD